MLATAFAACVVVAASAPAFAGPIANATYKPLISAGALPDSPEARVDPNAPGSAYSGVVSLYIQYDGQGYICSGALVGKRSVVSAGHCVDTDGNGSLIDINAPGNRVRVIFNVDGAYSSIITASKVSMHADYKGFGNCPVGVDSFCLNDDISVITLGEDAPAGAKIYKVATNGMGEGTRIMMAGYGTSGDGTDGFYVDPEFDVKRTGQNYADFYDLDDEEGFASGRQEVYYADFDGAGRDTFCDYVGICSPVLANDVESGIGGGDSGGPSFVMLNGEMTLVANNTFGSSFIYEDGQFGTYFGGMVLGSYADYLSAATDGQVTLVPEPGSLMLFGLGALALAGVRRRRSAK
ncbi:MAG: trypsin-like serine protease [Pseudomonadota bacterium]